MSFFSELEKFGFSSTEDLDITDEGKKKASVQKKTAAKPVKKLSEKELLYDKQVTCPICDKEVTVKLVRSGKLRRMEPDFDLRPRYEGLDTLKYDVTVCPHCGYAALNDQFEHVSPTARRLIRENVCSKFKGGFDYDGDTYTAGFAVERFQLALVTAMARRAKVSEKAYICLKTAWLLRDIADQMPEGSEQEKQAKEAKEKEYREFYEQAYHGFLKAESTETPPYFGMNNITLEYMLANMANRLKDYSTASKLVSNLLLNPSAPARVKDRCRDLKDEILAEVRKLSGEAPEGAKQ